MSEAAGNEALQATFGNEMHGIYRRALTEAGALETVGHVADSVEDFVQRAVATRGDNGFKAFADGFRSEASSRASAS